MFGTRLQTRLGRPIALGKGGVGAWILATHFWRDIGLWSDNDVWRD